MTPQQHRAHSELPPQIKPNNLQPHCQWQLLPGHMSKRGGEGWHKESHPANASKMWLSVIPVVFPWRWMLSLLGGKSCVRLWEASKRRLTQGGIVLCAMTFVRRTVCNYSFSVLLLFYIFTLFLLETSTFYLPISSCWILWRLTPGLFSRKTDSFSKWKSEACDAFIFWRTTICWHFSKLMFLFA